MERFFEFHRSSSRTTCWSKQRREELAQTQFNNIVNLCLLLYLWGYCCVRIKWNLRSMFCCKLHWKFSRIIHLCLLFSVRNRKSFLFYAFAPVVWWSGRRSTTISTSENCQLLFCSYRNWEQIGFQQRHGNNDGPSRLYRLPACYRCLCRSISPIGFQSIDLGRPASNCVLYCYLNRSSYRRISMADEEDKRICEFA